MIAIQKLRTSLSEGPFEYNKYNGILSCINGLIVLFRRVDCK